MNEKPILDTIIFKDKKRSPEQHPSEAELAQVYSDDELRARGPQWTAGYLFDEQESDMNTNIRLSSIFPNLSDEEVDGFIDGAIRWWRDKQ